MASDPFLPRVLYLANDGRERIVARANEWEFEQLGADSMGAECWKLRWSIERADKEKPQPPSGEPITAHWMSIPVPVYVRMARAALVALEEVTRGK